MIGVSGRLNWRTYHVTMIGQDYLEQIACARAGIAELEGRDVAERASYSICETEYVTEIQAGEVWRSTIVARWT